MDIAVCGKDGKVNMIEAGAKEIGEEIAIKGIEGALEEIAKMEEFQKKIIAEIGKEKIKIELKDKPKEIVELFLKTSCRNWKLFYTRPPRADQEKAGH